MSESETSGKMPRANGVPSRVRPDHRVSPILADEKSGSIGGEPRDLAARASAVADRVKGAIAGASLSLATAMTGAGATCATGRCGQGCGYACGIIGVTAAGGIAAAAIRRRFRGVDEDVG